VRAGTFSNSAHPDDDAKHGRLRKPTGHGRVYKVNGHGRPESSVGEENSVFFACPGGRSPRPPSIFFPVGLSRCDPHRLRQIAFWCLSAAYATECSGNCMS
jgi:hypothetical protein